MNAHSTVGRFCYEFVMDLDALLLELADPQTRNAATDTLVSGGRAVVEPLVAQLMAPEPFVDDEIIVSVLHRIGPPAYRRLTEAIANAALLDEPERIRRILELCCIAMDLPTDDLEKVATYADGIVNGDAKAERGAHRWPLRPENVATRIGDDRAVAYAPLLIPVLAHASARYKAAEAFAKLGPATLSLLHATRRAPIPERRGALLALVRLGWRQLDTPDLTALARLIAAKIAVATPRPIVPQGEWYAVETDDQAAVLDAFDLHDSIPATWCMGTQLWRNAMPYRPFEQDHSEHRDCTRMYVSPVLNGWTLVFGNPVLTREGDAHEREIELRRRHPITIEDVVEVDPPTERELRESRCIELSRRFGRAQWYSLIEDGGCGDRWGWCMAEHGRLQRYYEHDWYQDDADRSFDTFGAPHPAEAGLRYHDVRQWLSDNGFNRDEWNAYTRDAMVRVENAEPTPWGAPRPLDYHSLWRQFQQVTGVPDLATPLTVAAKASVNPAGIGPHTHVQGHGVLALTVCGLRKGHYGAFSIDEEWINPLSVIIE